MKPQQEEGGGGGWFGKKCFVSGTHLHVISVWREKNKRLGGKGESPPGKKNKKKSSGEPNQKIQETTGAP